MLDFREPSSNGFYHIVGVAQDRDDAFRAPQVI
jgi:hypothetical protein